MGHGTESMKRLISLVALVVIAGIGGAILFAGLRIVSLPPENERPGQTLVAIGLGDVRLIDSPAGYCRRTGDDDPLCPVSFRLAVAREGRPLIMLPYMSILADLAK
jgi:hypothetical protein